MLSLVKISVNNFHSIYDDAVESIAQDLTSVGIRVEVATNQIKASNLVVLVGQMYAATNICEVIEKLKNVDYVVVNLEYLSSVEGHLIVYPKYLELLRGALMVWDYSQTNIDFLTSEGFYHTALLKFKFRINYQLIDFKQHQFDRGCREVVMLGSFGTGRRQGIKDQLQTEGISVAHLFNVYGSERSEELKKFTFGLNIHNANILRQLEILRLKVYFENAVVPVSETADFDPFYGALCFGDYIDLTSITKGLVRGKTFDLKKHFQNILFSYESSPGSYAFHLILGIDLGRVKSQRSAFNILAVQDLVRASSAKLS